MIYLNNKYNIARFWANLANSFHYIFFLVRANEKSQLVPVLQEEKTYEKLHSHITVTRPKETPRPLDSLHDEHLHLITNDCATGRPVIVKVYKYGPTTVVRNASEQVLSQKPNPLAKI